ICMQEAAETLLPLAYKNNIGVIIKEPIANAFFLGKPKPDDDNAWQHPTWERAQKFLFMKELTNPSPIQAALKFVLDHEGVTTAIAATVDLRHFDENVKTSNLPSLHSELKNKIVHTSSVL
ncbi:MAG: aldo/keto reductase, partial [Fibrobacteres bacterium]|nr:aldo/keto reductase [Fibrobacterota bacterium]